MQMKIGAIIQARTSSTRLPEKVLKYLPYNSNITVLQQVIRRTKRSKLINDIIVATTNDEKDQKIVRIAEFEKVKWYRGSIDNVLERYYFAATEYKVDLIVRITSDCPCIDWNIIDKIIEFHIEHNSDYTSNTLQRTFPHGLDVEVFSFEVLEEAYYNATKDYEKEHVTPYIHTTNRDKFKICNFEAPEELSAPDIRITLDTEEDYVLLCAVFDSLYYKNEFFNSYNIVNLFKEKPWLKLINKKIVQKKIFNSVEEEIEEAMKILELQELHHAKKVLETWNHRKY